MSNSEMQDGATPASTASGEQAAISLVGGHHDAVDGDQDLNESDLQSLEQGADNLLSEGIITEKQAQETREAVAKVRKTFRELSPQQKKKIINARAITGQKMMDSTLTGSTAVLHDLKLDHGVLKNLFSQFVPFFDRAIVNMRMFGEETFGKPNNTERFKALTASATEFYEAALNARLEAEAMVEQFKGDFDGKGTVYFNPVVPNPALVKVVHVHTQIAMKYLLAYEEFNKLLTLCSWLEWNECRSSKEIAAVTRPLFNKAITTGRRSYSTFTDLMSLRAEKAKTQDGVTQLAA